MKIKITLFLSALFLSMSAMAHYSDPTPCKDMHVFSEVKQQLTKLDPKFVWTSPSCQVVGTHIIFPHEHKKGIVQFERGLQLAIYSNKQLQFICLPGWICKRW